MPALPTWALFSLSAAPIVAYGLSRFSYALILPAMKQDLQLDYSLAGGLGTANNIGYLLGALSAVVVVRPERARMAFTLGIAGTAALLLATALSSNYTVLALLRFLGGIPAAIALVAGGLIASHAGGGEPKRSALALNIYYSGGGAGIVLSTLAALPLLNTTPAGRWPQSWLILGVIALVCALPAMYLFRTMPAVPGASSSRIEWSGLGQPIVYGFAVALFLFGLGYSGYMTFVIAYLRENSASGLQQVVFWTLIGVASVAGAIAWGHLFPRMTEAGALAATMFFIAAGSALPVFSPNIVLLAVSAALFGSSFLSVVAAINYGVRGLLPQKTWAAALAGMTIVAGIGQSIGPILAGVISDHLALSNGLALSPVALACGGLVAWLAGHARASSEHAVKRDQ